MLNDVTLIAGPTASGKSSMAIDLARRTGATIVNADSMQVYSTLSLVTARPAPADLASAPHCLYGHISPGEPYSTGKWLRDVETVIDAENLRDRPVIFVGGTGLYFRALTEGLSPMPEIPSAIRERWRERLALEGAEALHGQLMEVDPDAATRIRQSDGQRIVRALEVQDASGEPISRWQTRRSRPTLDAGAARKLVLMPDRTILARRIEERFDRMIEEGALEEVSALMALDLPPSMPAMKAIGVPELSAVLQERMSLDEAIDRAKAATRQYAKRQATWFRHQLGDGWERMDI